MRHRCALHSLAALVLVAVTIVAGCGSESAGHASGGKPNANGESTPVVEAPSGPSSSDPKSDADAGGGASTAAEYAAEKAWAEAHGVTIDAATTTVVAKRRGDVRRSEIYQDMFVVFRPDQTLVRFVGTTKPAQMPSPKSDVVPDVDGDGRKDLGIVRPGVYRAHGDVTYGLPGYERNAFKVTMDDGDSMLPAWRDLDGDGVFSAAEKSTSEQRNYRIGGIYIHYGFAMAGTKLGPDEYVGPWSVGCQNIQYDELDTFIKAVGGTNATFRYAIIEVP